MPLLQLIIDAQRDNDLAFELERNDELCAEVKTLSAGGVSALMLAAFRGFPQTVRRLLELRSDPKLQTRRANCSALTMAVHTGNREVIENLLGHVDSDGHLLAYRSRHHQGNDDRAYGNSQRRPAEHGGLAMRDGISRRTSAATLVDDDEGEGEEAAGSLYGSGARYGVTRDVSKPSADVLELVQQREISGTTALLRACQNGFAEATLLLIDAHANVNQCRTDALRRTPLIMAARVGSPRCIKLLLDAHADVCVADGEGGTALTHAAFYGHAEPVEMLAAKEGGHSEPVEMLAAEEAARDHSEKGSLGSRARGGEAASSSGTSSGAGLTSASARFIDRQETVHEQTAIVVAARRGHLPTVQALIRQVITTDYH